MKVSLSELIDRLVILNLKIWHLEDGVRDPSKTDEEVGKLTRMMTRFNEQRTAIKNEIDEVLGEGAHDAKLYSHKDAVIGDTPPEEGAG
ncbi:MAG: DUF4254 domain-containing protein [bacterium]|nr:DUF4254 domain-containing protein [bacterium]